MLNIIRHNKNSNIIGEREAENLKTKQNITDYGNDDEYKEDEDYNINDAPYVEKTLFYEADHANAYEKNDDNKVLTQMEKGIIFATVFGKPVSTRRN